MRIFVLTLSTVSALAWVNPFGMYNTSATSALNSYNLHFGMHFAVGSRAVRLECGGSGSPRPVGVQHGARAGCSSRRASARAPPSPLAAAPSACASQAAAAHCASEVEAVKARLASLSAEIQERKAWLAQRSTGPPAACRGRGTPAPPSAPTPSHDTSGDAHMAALGYRPSRNPDGAFRRDGPMYIPKCSCYGIPSLRGCGTPAWACIHLGLYPVGAWLPALPL